MLRPQLVVQGLLGRQQHGRCNCCHNVLPPGCSSDGCDRLVPAAAGSQAAGAADAAAPVAAATAKLGSKQRQAVSGEGCGTHRQLLEVGSRSHPFVKGQVILPRAPSLTGSTLDMNWSRQGDEVVPSGNSGNSCLRKLPAYTLMVSSSWVFVFLLILVVFMIWHSLQTPNCLM